MDDKGEVLGLCLGRSQKSAKESRISYSPTIRCRSVIVHFNLRWSLNKTNNGNEPFTCTYIYFYFLILDENVEIAIQRSRTDARDYRVHFKDGHVVLMKPMQMQILCWNYLRILQASLKIMQLLKQQFYRLLRFRLPSFWSHEVI